ncbi:hypothetical protein DDB_G0275377 [Dictyostelium discoideum AX4]|uniref:Transmembrane protein n=1 Tax=Dictyostelium discoideum TaxID=44689 RepID=Q553P8_DICDI|nr:hypothetical protein DDB_G0275377 [Dictyostelium discoideum AX4]EAL69754.1 hypothetical protein DDB_G0275377 [Dictyostelium discoideum AX4]|eukprot:XP_643698.1 hypothetical protein DDB_G0275377 [Dictyostelium discoideum AX4]
MRVFLFKIASKQRWTLYIEKSEFFSKKVDIEPTIVTTSSNNNNITLPTQSKGVLILNKLKNIAIESKNEIDNAQDGVGLKGKLKSLLSYLESKIHPEEAVLQQFSKINDNNLIKKHNHHNHHNHIHHNNNNNNNQNETVKHQFEHFNEQRDKASFTIYYPSNIGYRRANRFSQVLMRQKIRFHQKWMIINSLLIPITFAATILPGPNIFLAYNLYRLYGHFQALKGCTNLSRYTKSHGRLLFKPSLEMFECLDGELLQQQQQFKQQQQQQQQQQEEEEQSIDNPNSYEKLSTRLRIPGLFDYVKRIETIENK